MEKPLGSLASASPKGNLGNNPSLLCQWCCIASHVGRLALAGARWAGAGSQVPREFPMVLGPGPTAADHTSLDLIGNSADRDITGTSEQLAEQCANSGESKSKHIYIYVCVCMCACTSCVMGGRSSSLLLSTVKYTLSFIA